MVKRSNDEMSGVIKIIVFIEERKQNTQKINSMKINWETEWIYQMNGKFKLQMECCLIGTTLDHFLSTIFDYVTNSLFVTLLKKQYFSLSVLYLFIVFMV